MREIEIIEAIYPDAEVEEVSGGVRILDPGHVVHEEHLPGSWRIATVNPDPDIADLVVVLRE